VEVVLLFILVKLSISAIAQTVRAVD
jgi:hypothetical protein